MMLHPRVALSLALPTTEATLSALARAAPSIGAAEIRLDLMERYSVRHLVRESPVPLILTHRPRREGGGYEGDEEARLRPLLEGLEAGCRFIDIEWDAAEAFLRRVPEAASHLIVSRHWLREPAPALRAAHAALAAVGGAVVKVATHARDATDTLRVLRLLRETSMPTIAMAMGSAGAPSRLLCLREPACVLTYAARDVDALTAPGQFTLDEMLHLFRLPNISATTPLFAALGEARPVRLNQALAAAGRDALCVPIEPAAHESILQLLEGYAELPIRGYAVAVPYQEVAFQALAAQPLSPAARQQRRVDLILPTENGFQGLWLDGDEAAIIDIWR